MLPHLADSHNDLGCRLLRRGRLAEALACFEAAARLKPDCAEAHFNCALAHRQQGDPRAAARRLAAALRIREDFFEARFVLGNILLEAGELDQAAAAYRRCLAAQPGSAEAHYNLGKTLHASGRLDAAADSLRRAVEIRPDFAEALNDLGLVLQEAGRLEEAVAHYRAALAVRPQLKEAHYNLGIARRLDGDAEAAAAHFRRALEADPRYAPARWLLDFSLPVIYADALQVAAARGRFAANLERLVRETPLDTAEDRRRALEGVASTTHFYLAYQGRNDRDLQETYGRFVARVMAANYPAWSRPRRMPPRRPNGRMRIGYVSSFMRAHTVGHFLLGWLEAHRRERFEIFAYHIGQAADATTDRIKLQVDCFRQLGGRLEAAAAAIAGDDLHALIFTDVGMHARATQLAGLRLAPLQCKGWGHPVTTGLPTIDCYLSSDLMEPEGAQAHYTERLVRLPNLALNVSPPRLPAAPRTRPALGLPPEGVLYLSSQSLFKYLPDHDDIYPRIAREVPEARFIFIAHRQPGITRRFRARLDRAFRAFGLDAGRYCHFQPQRAYEDFLSVNLRCDILLDTLEWSGGKTTLEAIACGLPVVTLPGRFMRGRHAYAMLAMMGIRETVAADKEAYIRIAAALGSDAGAREQARRLLAERRDRLYGDTRFMRALEDFLAAEVERRT